MQWCLPNSPKTSLLAQPPATAAAETNYAPCGVRGALDTTHVRRCGVSPGSHAPNPFFSAAILVCGCLLGLTQAWCLTMALPHVMCPQPRCVSPAAMSPCSRLRAGVGSSASGGPAFTTVRWALRWASQWQPTAAIGLAAQRGDRLSRRFFGARRPCSSSPQLVSPGNPNRTCGGASTSGRQHLPGRCLQVSRTALEPDTQHVASHMPVTGQGECWWRGCGCGHDCGAAAGQGATAMNSVPWHTCVAARPKRSQASTLPPWHR